MEVQLDELYAAKVELAKIVAQLPSAPDVWSKLVSTKETPTLRRGADGAHRRSQEAEDVLEMTAIAETSMHLHHDRTVQLTKELILLIISQLLCQRVGQIR